MKRVASRVSMMEGLREDPIFRNIEKDEFV